MCVCKVKGVIYIIGNILVKKEIFLLLKILKDQVNIKLNKVCLNYVSLLIYIFFFYELLVVVGFGFVQDYVYYVLLVQIYLCGFLWFYGFVVKGCNILKIE